MEGLRKLCVSKQHFPLVVKQHFPLVVISTGVKPFLAPRPDSVFYHSSAKRSVLFGTVPGGRLMLLYLKKDFVVVKQGNSAPNLWSWWLKLEAG